jgi:SAM-dependent methyltransferase
MKTLIAQLFSRLNGNNKVNHVNLADLSPLNPLPLPSTDNLNSKEDIYNWIEYGIGCFREWYQPVDFGNGVVAHVTTPPYWLPQPELLNVRDRGIGKWHSMIKKHIPDVKGKRVLDLGCSSGLYSLELARLGAREVIGIDRNQDIKHRSTDVPPAQDVIAQANFVKRAFELLYGVEYPVKYMAHDIGNPEELDLGQFDLIIALCVVYHELDRMPRLVKRLAEMTNHLVLQSSNGHGGELGKWADKMCQAEVLFQAGFTNVEIESTPEDPLLPIIIGRKQ